MNEMINGDCREVLKRLPECSVQCCVTSPPYYGLRDYGVAEQIGLESTPDEYVAQLVSVFREVRRVLRDDGTLWLNLGDSYASTTKGSGGDGTTGTLNAARKQDGSYIGSAASAYFKPRTFDLNSAGLKPKDIIGIPWRVAFALQSDGWYLRSEITWCKKAPMPESVTDRPTSATEKIFLLTKSARYFYDADAVKEAMTPGVSPPGNKKPYDASRPDGMTLRGNRVNEHLAQSGRNLRNFWLLGPDPYPGAHFATMPRRIPEIAIMAGTSEAGCCAECGAPYQRIVEKGLTAHDGQTQTAYPAGTTSNRLALLRQAARERGEEYRNESRTVGWQPTCACHADTVPCVVLDPFLGSGTTGEVAQRLGRNWIGIELNPDYLPLIAQRTSQSAFHLQ